MNPSLLLFDLGGVLIENAAFQNLSSLLPEPQDSDTIKERWLFSPAVRQHELGEISSAVFAENFIAEWDLDLSPEAFIEAFVSWPRDFYPQALETLEILRQDYRIACLSNSNPLHWEKFGGFTGLFDIALFSHLLGAIKPDPQAFELAIEQCAVNAEEIYFFDDCQANVDTAKAMGMQAFQVDGFQPLQELLRKQGFLA